MNHQIVFVYHFLSLKEKKIYKMIIFIEFSTKNCLFNKEEKTQILNLQNLTVILMSFDRVFVINGYTKMRNCFFMVKYQENRKYFHHAIAQGNWPKKIDVCDFSWVYMSLILMSSYKKNTRTTQTKHKNR